MKINKAKWNLPPHNIYDLLNSEIFSLCEKRDKIVKHYISLFEYKIPEEIKKDI